jgi:hypothetical protein
MNTDIKEVWFINKSNNEHWFLQTQTSTVTFTIMQSKILDFWNMMLHQWLSGFSKYLSSETAPHPEHQNPCLATLITETCASVQLNVVRTAQDTA